MTLAEQSLAEAEPSAALAPEPTLDDAVDVACRLVFDGVPRLRVRAMLQGGFPVMLLAGASVPGSAHGADCLLVTSGLIRTYVSSVDGRETTSGYLRGGDFICPLGRRDRPDVGVMPIGAAAGWVIELANLRRRMEGDAAIAAAIAEYSVSILYAAVEQLRFASFATVRQRVVRHIIELFELGSGPEDLLPARTQEIADAVGTVREVVSRALRDLERDRMIRFRKHGVIVREPQRLFDEIRTIAPARVLATMNGAQRSAAQYSRPLRIESGTLPSTGLVRGLPGL